ncbi:MAG: hypothetical protein ACRD2L_24625, partial [Terriglobia bacterium]
HETEVSEGVQEEDREQDGPRFQLVESRENVDPCGDPEHQRAEQEIDGQDVHKSLSDPARREWDQKPFSYIAGRIFLGPLRNSPTSGPQIVPSIFCNEIVL